MARLTTALCRGPDGQPDEVETNIQAAFPTTLECTLRSVAEPRSGVRAPIAVLVSVLALFAVLCIGVGSPVADAGALPTASPSPAALPTTLVAASVVGGPYDFVTVPVLLSAPAPGVGAFSFDLTYDPQRLTAISCTSTYAACRLEATAPNTITFAGFTAVGITGENLQFGAVTFATGPAEGETQVTVAKVKLYDATGDSLTADVSSAVVTLVVPEHIQGNINCLGPVGVDDVTALLAALSSVAFNHRPGCTPPGQTIHGVLWGDLNCDRNVNAFDVLALLRYLSGAGGTGGCPVVGDVVA